MLGKPKAISKRQPVMVSKNYNYKGRLYPTANALFMWLVLGLMSLILVILFTHQWLMVRELSQGSKEASQRLGAYKTSLLATIDRHLYLPQVLASDPRVVRALATLESGDRSNESTKKTSLLLNRINEKAGSNEIFLMGSKGNTYYSSNFKSDTSFVGENYSFRPYFKDAVKGKIGFYFAVGATSGIPGLFLSAPVYSRAPELPDILGVIVVKIYLGDLEKSWNSSSDAVWVTDKKGIIFLASDSKWHYYSIGPLPTTVKKELARTKQYGNNEVEPLDRATEWQAKDWSTFDLKSEGVQVVFDSEIKGYPWKMHFHMPLDTIQNRVRWKQSLIILLYASVAVAILFYLERRRRTQAQNALVRLTAERETHQRAIIQNTDVGLINLNSSFKPLFVNEQARSLFAIEHLRSPISPSELIEPWNSKEAGQGPCRAEGIRADGTRFPILYTLNPIKVGEKNEFILTVQDITELTSAQKALQEANKTLEKRVAERTRDLENAQAALAQNQKLAALGRMSAAIAHEINQPITALSNFIASSQVLLVRNKPESVQNNFEKMKSIVERLSKLSRQLRIFAGKRNTGGSRVSINAPIQYALELLGPKLESNHIRCDINISEDQFVHANTMVLEQIVVNLLTNAIDALAGETNARIDIRLAHVKKPDKDQVELSIEDNGHGMTTDQKSKVFEPFFTTKPMGQGLGLGLAISYSLACDIGGDLTVESRFGEGTCFTLKLPVARCSEQEIS